MLHYFFYSSAAYWQGTVCARSAGFTLPSYLLSRAVFGTGAARSRKPLSGCRLRHILSAAPTCGGMAAKTEQGCSWRTMLTAFRLYVRRNFSRPKLVLCGSTLNAITFCRATFRLPKRSDTTLCRGLKMALRKLVLGVECMFRALSDFWKTDGDMQSYGANVHLWTCLRWRFQYARTA